MISNFSSPASRAMFDIKFIRENPEKVKEGLKKKGVYADVENILSLDKRKRVKIKEVDDLRARQNQLSEEIAKLPGDGRKEKIEESRKIKEKLMEVEAHLVGYEQELDEKLSQIPNIPFDDVPVGPDESGNVEIRAVGEKPKFSFTPRDHVEIGEKLDLIDTRRAAKVSGSRFGYLKQEASLLEFALVQFALSFLTNRENIARTLKEENLSLSDKPFIPVVPPALIGSDAMRAMGYMERGGEEIYHIEKDNLYLVGTAEQAIGPMHMNEVFAEGSLPRRHVAFSTCFRREAGSYGRDTKGILRVHQFDKIEMFSVAVPETSRDEHKLFLALEERMFQALKIPYHVLAICTGDLGDPAAAKFDIEAWLPGQKNGEGEYREVTSTSNTTDFQARRLNTKYVTKEGERAFPHMLNGTAFAIGRTLIAIFENYQQEDGSLKIPEILQPYMFGIKEIRR